MPSPSARHVGGETDGAPEVQIRDTPAVRVRHPADLLGLVLTVLGIALVLVLAVYAHGTTTGLTEDVRGFASIVRRILFMPVAVLLGLITLIAPISVLTELVVRRHFRHAIETVAAAVLGVLTALAATWLITGFGGEALTTSFSILVSGRWTVTIPALIAGTAALVTAAGTRNQRRTVAWSWNLLWIGLGVVLITGQVTLPGALITVLLGRSVGLGLRYAFGVRSGRAYGSSLVEGIRRAGLEPASLIRAGAANPDQAEASHATDPATLAITRYRDNRIYAMSTTDGEELDVVVLDGDRQVVGMLTWFWRSMRFRGIDGRAIVSLRQTVERAALLSYAAWAAGVCTPRLRGIAEAEDSMILIQDHTPGAVPLRDVPERAITNRVLSAVWEQLGIAHEAGLAHRALTSDVVLVGPDQVPCPAPAGSRRKPKLPTVRLTGWEYGDVASSDLARRLDISHMLIALALRVGAERAVASAARVFSDAELAAIGPLLQLIVMPRATRDEARQRRGVLVEVREALISRIPAAVVQPERLVRFGVRTVVTIALTTVAMVVVVATISFDQITAAVANASPWWAALTFLLGLTAFLGAAVALVAFSPVRLPLWRTTLVQASAAFVALVAPAGVGPAAINLRLLVRRGVSSSLAAASVGLVQVSQLVSTIGLLLVFSLVSGRESALELPSATVLVALALVAVLVALALLVPPLRRWVARRTVPVWRATWPRLLHMLGQPRRFVVAAAGNLLVTLSYVGAFYASLSAFGIEMSLIDLALIYLLGNAAGAVVPSPGGLGPVEVALIGSLSASGGVPVAIATSVVVLFRGLTFWARVPVGWLAMRSLQRSGDL